MYPLRQLFALFLTLKMADSADLNYTTFCPHCEASLPPRTFRYHRERYFDEKTGVWEKLNNACSDEDVGEMDVA